MTCSACSPRLAAADRVGARRRFLSRGLSRDAARVRENPICPLSLPARLFRRLHRHVAGGRCCAAEPTPKADADLTYFTIGSFKIVSWVAAAWLLAILPCSARLQTTAPRDAVPAGSLRRRHLRRRRPRHRRQRPRHAGWRPACGLRRRRHRARPRASEHLGDVFSGIVLNLAKPNHAGDWIILDGGTQGRVIETDWRATHGLSQSTTSRSYRTASSPRRS